MPDPDLRVSFYFTSQVNQIWSGLIPFYPIGLQLRVTTFWTPSFAFKRGEGGSDLTRGFRSEWIGTQTKFTKLAALQALCEGSIPFTIPLLHPSFWRVYTFDWEVWVLFLTMVSMSSTSEFWHSKSVLLCFSANCWICCCCPCPKTVHFIG